MKITLLASPSPTQGGGATGPILLACRAYPLGSPGLSSWPAGPILSECRLFLTGKVWPFHTFVVPLQRQTWERGRPRQILHDVKIGDNVVAMLRTWAVYGITCQGNLLLIYLLAMLLDLFFSSLGLIISNYSDTMQQAVFVMWFFIVCLMLLSGLFTPTRSMPSWAYATTYINPMSYFIDSIRTVFIRGGDFRSIAHQVFALGSISLLMSIWAVLSYKKNH